MKKLLKISACVIYYLNMNNTIVAISTPMGKGAISIVRLSGDKSLFITKKVFLCRENIEPRKMILGKFIIEQGITEKCLMVYFKSPNSFTGEDIVEFHIHGGIILARKIQQKLIEEGAVLAEPGEFSKRAFENGKISLDEAESIIGEINSESEAELKSVLSSASGKLLDKIKNIQSDLTMLLAEIEVTMDYPEEDENEVVRDKIFEKLDAIQLSLREILKNADEARYIRNGVNVALVGKANVGKSSLLNALIGENKAIVTSTEGTTRDVIEAKVDFQGIRFNFFDTAGIRDSNDEIEKIGIEKSKEKLEECDLVLLIYDGSEEFTKNDNDILKIIKKPFISVINKKDLKRKMKKQENEISVSAKLESNIEQLKQKIYDTIIKNEINFNGLVVTNERQLNHLKEAEKQIEEIFSVKNESLEIISMLIKKVWNELGKITGETENEDIISLIFSKFCVGK